MCLLGTLQAAIQLLKKTGAEVVQALVIMELCDLEGRKKIDIPVKSFIQYWTFIYINENE